MKQNNVRKGMKWFIVIFVFSILVAGNISVDAGAKYEGKITVTEKSIVNLKKKFRKLKKGKYTFKSSNKKIATVNSKGIVKGKKAGTATVTAKNKKTGKKAKYKITVKKKKSEKKKPKKNEPDFRFKNPSVKIALCNDTSEDGGRDLASLLKVYDIKCVEKGQSNNWLYVYYSSDYSDCFIEIQSSNPDVVQVGRWGSYYTIEIKSAGIATITLTCNGKKAKCKITVTDPKISSAEVNKIVGGTYKLDISGTTGKVTWKSENEAIAKVDSQGNVTAVGPGTTSIKAIVDNGFRRCKFTTEIVPQFLNTYQMKGINSVVLADTVLRTTEPNKFDTMADADGKKLTKYNWENVGDITTEDFSTGNVYPVFDIEISDGSSYKVTEIYLVGSSQNAVIRRLDTEIGGNKDVYWEYVPGKEMGTIKNYYKDNSSALYSVTIDGHTLVFATYCRSFGEKEPTNKPIGQSSTKTYVKANASTMNIDTSGVMASVAKYVVDKIIETAVTALINKFFPW